MSNIFWVKKIISIAKERTILLILSPKLQTTKAKQLKNAKSFA